LLGENIVSDPEPSSLPILYPDFSFLKPSMHVIKRAQMNKIPERKKQPKERGPQMVNY
jgi:hypothetical protein